MAASGVDVALDPANGAESRRLHPHALLSVDRRRDVVDDNQDPLLRFRHVPDLAAKVALDRRRGMTLPESSVWVLSKFDDVPFKQCRIES